MGDMFQVDKKCVGYTQKYEKLKVCSVVNMGTRVAEMKGIQGVGAKDEIRENDQGQITQGLGCAKSDGIYLIQNKEASGFL